MSDERVENKRYVRRIQQEARERELDERLARAEQEKILRQKQLDQEEKLAMVLLFMYSGVYTLCMHIHVCVMCTCVAVHLYMCVRMYLRKCRVCTSVALYAFDSLCV